MINDGVCDDVTNNKRCLYDGGDCCQAEKSSFCQDCTCKLDIDIDDLTAELEALQVKALLNSDQIEDIIKAENVTVENVINIHVCSVICMEKSHRYVNAWRYFTKSKTCECALVVSTHCLMPNFEVISPEVVAKSWRLVESAAFVMTSQTLPCGKLESFTQIWLFSAKLSLSCYFMPKIASFQMPLTILECLLLCTQASSSPLQSNVSNRVKALKAAVSFHTFLQRKFSPILQVFWIDKS